MLHIFYFKCQFLPHFLQVKCSILLLKKVELCDMSGLNNCYAIEYYKSKSPKEWKLCQKLSWILPFSRKCSEQKSTLVVHNVFEIFSSLHFLCYKFQQENFFYTNSLIIMIHRQCKTVTEIQSSELKTIMVDIDCGP